MPPLVVKWSKCSVSIASARTTIDHKAYDAVISNMGFVNSVLGDFTVDRQATGWRSARCDISGTSLPIHALSQDPLLSRHRTSTRRANVALNDDS